MPPIVFAYFVTMPLHNPGGWILNAVTLGILFGAITVILGCVDPDVKLSDWERKWGHITAIEIIVILCLVGVAGMLVTYADPSFEIASPSHNLLLPTELDFAALGYPESEYEDRFRAGVIWLSLTLIVFLAAVDGSYLVSAIRNGRIESDTT